MDQALFRILYCSRNLIGGIGGVQNEPILHILETARTNNGRKNVTGALLYNAGYFAQVLEGPRAAIEQVFERIQRDARHGDVTVLECAGISERDFPAWSMARVQPVSEVQAADATYALHAALGNPKASGRSVLELLRSLVVYED
ncbi:MAG: BLUF domain-containing protein [Janthinobacterium lividum]